MKHDDDIVRRMIDKLDRVDIPAPVYRTAVRLLLRTHPENGYARIAYEDMPAICGTDKPETARGHLAILAKHDLLTYRRNGAWNVIWHDPADESRGGRAESSAPRAPSSAGRAESAPGRADGEPGDLTGDNESRGQRAQSSVPRAESVPGRALPHTRPSEGLPIQEGRKEGDPSLPSLPDAREPDPETATDIERSVALLADPDIGANEAFARTLAVAYPFAEIRRQVFRLRRDLASGGAKSWGALATRLKNHWPATITDADKDSELWARHETHADRRKAYDPYYEEQRT